MKRLLLATAIVIANIAQAITIQEMRKIPKAELHLHLGGSYPLSYLKTIATPHDYTALVKGIDRFVSGVDYHQGFFIFGLMSKIVNTLEYVEEGTYQLCKALKEDGVTYAEIRTSLKDMGGGYGAYLKAVLHGIKRARSDTFTGKLLLSVKRTSTPAFAQATIDLALRYTQKGVIGIDLSDNATIGDIKTILPILEEGKQQGLPFVVHMGESAKETDQMLVLTRLEPVRIGHGVHLKPEALDWIKAHNIPLEVCLSSSVCTQMVDSCAAHPGLVLHQKGHPIVLCSDDPLIFRTSLSDEYLQYAHATGDERGAVYQLARASFNYRL